MKPSRKGQSSPIGRLGPRHTQMGTFLSSGTAYSWWCVATHSTASKLSRRSPLEIPTLRITHQRFWREAPVSCRRCPPVNAGIFRTNPSSGLSANWNPHLRVWAGRTDTPMSSMRKNCSCHTPCRRTRKRARLVLRLSSFLYPSNWLDDEKDLLRLDFGGVFGANLDNFGARRKIFSAIGDGRETLHDFYQG